MKGSKDSDRDAIVLALCSRTFKSQTIVFANSKVAHTH